MHPVDDQCIWPWCLLRLTSATAPQWLTAIKVRSLSGIITASVSQYWSIHGSTDPRTPGGYVTMAKRPSSSILIYLAINVRLSLIQEESQVSIVTVIDDYRSQHAGIMSSCAR